MSIEVAEMDVADRLTVAIKRIEKLREALAPFAEAFDEISEEDKAAVGDKEINAMPIDDILFRNQQPSVGDLRRAREALDFDH